MGRGSGMHTLTSPCTYAWMCTQGRKLNRMAVKEEHQRKTQPNYERRLREEERKEAHERWRKDLEVCDCVSGVLMAVTWVVLWVGVGDGGARRPLCVTRPPVVVVALFPPNHHPPPPLSSHLPRRGA